MLLVATHEACWNHNPGEGHPERADRLTAVQHGLAAAGVEEAIEWVEAPLVDLSLVEGVHERYLIDRVETLAEAGGGFIDGDTAVSAGSSEAAARAAGAGIELIARLDRGEGDAGWSVVRPPGHHATPDRQMGFCLYNNVAVAAQYLADRGERVLIVDVDAHHGNGTQDAFYANGQVCFVSFHQFPLYPFTGRPDEIGEGDGLGTTVNVALPPNTSGYTYHHAFDTVVAPVIERFAPTWVLISAGFDGHRRDPLTDLGLTSADYGDLVVQIASVVPAGRRLLFLEGGYDLEAMSACAGAVAAGLVDGNYRPEHPSEQCAVDEGEAAASVEIARRLHVAP